MSVWFGPSVAFARRAAARAPGGGARAERDLASPRATAALVRALASGEPVVVVDPPRRTAVDSPRRTAVDSPRRTAAWERAKRRILLPPPPGLLHAAIGGIAAHEAPPRKPDGRPGATRAHWIPGDLTDARAAAILAAPPVSPLWVVEDFRKLRVGPATEAKLEANGIRIAAYRALRVARRRPRR